MNARESGRSSVRPRIMRSASLRALAAWALMGLAWPAGAAFAQQEDPGIQPPPEVAGQTNPPLATEPAAEEDKGFPRVGQSPDVPDAAIDGPTYEVSSISLQYVLDHPDLPTIDALMQVPVEIVQTPQGWVAPRPGLPTVWMRISDFNDGQTRTLYASAIKQIGRAIIQYFQDQQIAGVLIEPAQITATGQDRRGGSTELVLNILNVHVTELHTIASGARIAVENRFDSPKHRRIIEHSPVQPYDEDRGGERYDLVRRDLLDSYAMRLNRHPGRRVDVAIVRGAEQGDVEVHYLVQENKPWMIYAQLSNTGTENTNEWRERFGFVHNQLTNHDDTLSLEYITAGFNESHAVVGSYEAPVGDLERLRWRAQGTWNKFDASEVGILDERFTGEGWTVGGDLIWNFYQNRNLFIDLLGGVRYEHIEVTNETLGFASRGEDDLFLPHIGLQAEQNGETSNFFASLLLEWTESGVSGATPASLEQLGRLGPDGDWYTLQWDTSLSFYLEPVLNYAAWSDPSTPESSTLAHEIYLAFRGQYAFDKRLIPNAEQVVGGLYTVRGYDESIAAGDSTWVGTLEYRFHVPRAFPIQENPSRRLFGRTFKVAPQQVYGQPDWDLILKGFLDAGQTINSDRRSFERNETLVGAGVGLELQVLTNVNIRTDWGFALSDVGNGLAEAGDNRLHVVLTILF